MRAILRYFISLILLSVCFVSSAQDALERQVFVRTGLDLSRFLLPFVKDYGQTGLEVSFDTEVKYKYFPTIELGYSKIKDYTDLHEYDSYGNYFRLGFNYNMLKYKHRLDRSMFFVGARYGHTAYTHEAHNIKITNGYGTFETSMPKTNLSANWMEGVIGLRGEILTNFYMGYTIRVKFIMPNSYDKTFTPYWIPGYGEGSKTVAVGMSYSVFYAIPIKKPKLDFEK